MSDEFLSGACWQCGRKLAAAEYGRSLSCPGCDSDTRSCRNCDYYDPSASRECREPLAEVPKDKERGNFCELFRPGKPQAAGGRSAKSAEASAKSAFDALFKKPKD